LTRPGYKMTEIGEIPEEWVLVEMGDNKVSEIVMGQSPPSSFYNTLGVGMPFLQGNADFGEIYPQPRIFCNKPLKVAEKGDILLSVRAPVGELNISAFKCIIGRGLAAIRVKDKNTHYKYLYYYLKYAANRLRALSTGSTFKAIGKNILSHFEICLPDFEEQQKIAEILSSMDETIQRVNDQITKTERLKKGLMQTLLTKGIGHAKFKMTEIGEIPEEWSLKSISEFSVPVSGIDPSFFGRFYFKYIDVSGISSERLAIVDTKEIQGVAAPSRARKVVKEDDIIFATVRPYLKRVAIVPKYLDGQVCSSAFCIVRANRNEIMPRFLYYYMTFDKFVNKISGFQTGSAYPAVSDSQIMSERVAVPTLHEQQKIAEVLLNIDLYTSSLENYKAKLNSVKKGLMQDLLTGKVRINNLKGVLNINGNTV